jgi:hypothetical protein
MLELSSSAAVLEGRGRREEAGGQGRGRRKCCQKGGGGGRGGGMGQMVADVRTSAQSPS